MASSDQGIHEKGRFLKAAQVIKVGGCWRSGSRTKLFATQPVDGPWTRREVREEAAICQNHVLEEVSMSDRRLRVPGGGGHKPGCQNKHTL